MDIKTKKQITLRFLTVILSICFFSISGLGLVLIKNQNISELIYEKYIASHPEFINYKDYFISEYDYLPYELIKLFLEAESESNQTKQSILIDNLLNKLGDSFLSEQKKTIWIEALKLNYLNNNTESKAEVKATYIDQIKSIQNKNTLFQQPLSADLFRLTDLAIKNDDDFYLNGWKITNEERANIFLNKKLLYHFLILSNSMAPLAKIEKPNDLIIDRKPLASGNCNQSFLSNSFDKISKQKIAVLFDQDCISNLATFPKDLNEPQIEKFSNNYNNFKPNWRTSPYSYGALIIGLGLLVNYSELKTYRIRINLPF